MSTELKSRVPHDNAPEERPAPGEVYEHLDSIVSSYPFRTSRQCKELLRYLVQHSLTNDDASLRERVIGMEVFGRDAMYDTNQDPVVRIRAADVRKRLAQFYQSRAADTAPFHLDLQPGSYRVHFRSVLQTVAPPQVPQVSKLEDGGVTSLAQTEPAPHVPLGIPSDPVKDVARSERRRSWLLGRVLLAITTVLILALLWNVRPTPEQRFWAPMMESKQPVLVYLGSNMAYIFSPEFLSRYQATHGLVHNGPEFAVDLSVMSTVRTEDLVPVQDTFVTTADLSATVALTTQLRDLKKPFVLRAGNDLSMGDMRNRPSLLVGGFNNPWTLQMTKALPFTMREGTTIQERDGLRRSWSRPANARMSTTEDYALISRILNSATGGPSITVAGIGQYGTQAAAELLTSPDRLRDFLATLPKGWESKDLQAVLRVQVLQYQPVAVDVVAKRCW